MQNSSKSSKRTISSRNNASLGGEARTRNFADQPELLKQWSSWGGKATLEKYGPEHFREIRELRQHYSRQCSQKELGEAARIRRSFAAQVNGRKGGLVRAELYGEEHRREWGRLGGIATRNRYGSEFYQAIRQMRVTYREPGYITRRTKVRLRNEALNNLKTEENWGIRELWRATARSWKNLG